MILCWVQVLFEARRILNMCESINLFTAFDTSAHCIDKLDSDVDHTDDNINDNDAVRLT